MNNRLREAMSKHKQIIVIAIAVAAIASYAVPYNNFFTPAKAQLISSQHNGGASGSQTFSGLFGGFFKLSGNGGSANGGNGGSANGGNGGSASIITGDASNAQNANGGNGGGGGSAGIGGAGGGGGGNGGFNFGFANTGFNKAAGGAGGNGGSANGGNGGIGGSGG